MKASIMEVKIKRLHPDSVIPCYARAGDAGLDLVAVSVQEDELGNLVYGTGLAIEIPKGYVGLLFPRSSNSKKDLILTNHVGVVDSGYRGEITFKYRPMYAEMVHTSWWRRIVNRFIRNRCNAVAVSHYARSVYDIGDRIGQLVIIKYPKIDFIETDTLTNTERGAGGYGSTGR